MSASLLTLVPGTGLEPVRPQWSRDFKSLVSTNSTIWAPFISAWHGAIAGAKIRRINEMRVVFAKKCFTMAGIFIDSILYRRFTSSIVELKT